MTRYMLRICSILYILYTVNTTLCLKHGPIESNKNEHPHVPEPVSRLSIAPFAYAFARRESPHVFVNTCGDFTCASPIRCRTRTV